MTPTTAHIDPRYSDEKAEAVPWTDAEARLAAAEVAWIVTVRPDGRPHATPMVPVVHDGTVYFHTGSTEVKYANLRANPHVLVLAGDTAWERGLDVAVEGDRRCGDRRCPAAPSRRALPGPLGRSLATSTSPMAPWSPRTPASPLVVFEVRPSRACGHAKGDPFGQTTYRFVTQDSHTQRGSS